MTVKMCSEVLCDKVATIHLFPSVEASSSIHFCESHARTAGFLADKIDLSINEHCINFCESNVAVVGSIDIGGNTAEAVYQSLGFFPCLLSDGRRAAIFPMGKFEKEKFGRWSYTFAVPMVPIVLEPECLSELVTRADDGVQ